jgi:hypothetical protein
MGEEKRREERLIETIQQDSVFQSILHKHSSFLRSLEKKFDDSIN